MFYYPLLSGLLYPIIGIPIKQQGFIGIQLANDGLQMR